MGIMEGRTSHEIKHKYTELYAPALLANWSVWPVAQVRNCPSARIFLTVPLAPDSELQIHPNGISSTIPVLMWGGLDIVSIALEL